MASKVANVNREEFLNLLDAVSPGLSAKKVLQQSGCFTFQDGLIQTFNGDIACSTESGLDEKITAAVSSTELVPLLQKLKEEELELIFGKDSLVIKGKRKESELPLEGEIKLPIDMVERGTEWVKMGTDFCDAANLVYPCAGKDAANFHLTCVHIHPKWIEASNQFQMMRYNLKTKVPESILVKAQSMKHIAPLGMGEMCVTDTWLHFRNPNNVVISLIRFVAKFPELDKFFEVKGQKMTIPKDLGDSAEIGSIFSAEGDTDEVMVELRPGKLRFRAASAVGKYKEYLNIKYTGEPCGFTIPPATLIELTKRYNQCEFCDNRMKISDGKFTYITCLGEIPNGKS